MVANTDLVVLRALKLNAQVADLVISGKRDAEAVANILQAIKDGRKLEFTDAVFADIRPLTIDCSHSFDQMVKAGKYKSVNPRITAENFPIHGSGKKQFLAKLFHFNRHIASQEAIAEIKKEKWLPAPSEVAIAFSEQYPDLQEQFPIVALGSFWQDPGGARHVLVLAEWYDGGRILDLYWFEGGWLDRYRFLAVREV